MTGTVNGRAIFLGTCVVSACGVSLKYRAATHCEHLIIELTAYLSKRAKLVFLPAIMLCYEGRY